MSTHSTPAKSTGKIDAALAGVRLYDEDAEHLLDPSSFAERVALLPGDGGRTRPGERIRIMWGQDLLRDLLDGRYRTVICGVNDVDNSHGIIAQLVELIPTSQWSAKSVTSYAKMFQESAAIHAGGDREPYILKFDLDSLLILALLRPRGRAHFTVEDLSRGFRTINKMLHDRHERQPAATVSFLNAKANRLVGQDAKEPSFESVLRTMYESGFRGDVYTSLAMWRFGHVGVFPCFPFPEGLERMRGGSS
jgi:hypothetical protein